jgi:hypothetical protein
VLPIAACTDLATVCTGVTGLLFEPELVVRTTTGAVLRG